MSSGVPCICEGNKATKFREKYWGVSCYRGNFSAFNGYRFAPSDYSEIRCSKCGGVWRTKANYVELLERL